MTITNITRWKQVQEYQKHLFRYHHASDLPITIQKSWKVWKACFFGYEKECASRNFTKQIPICEITAMFKPIAHVQSATIFISLHRLKFHGKTRDWSLDWSWNITTTTTRTVRFVLEFRKVYVNLGTPLQPCTKLGIRFPPKKLRLNKSSEFAIRRYQIPIRGSKTRLSVASILKSSGRLSKSCTSGQVCLTNSAKKEQDKRICVGVGVWMVFSAFASYYIRR